MNELAFANIITTFSAIVLAVVALVIGYSMGYKDAVRHMEKKDKQ